MSTKKRIQLDLPEQSVIRLKSLCDETEASSYAEVFKNALRLYEFMIEETKKGNKFAVIDKNKNSSELIIF